MARLIFRAFQCEMELDYIIASRVLLAPVKVCESLFLFCESIKNCTNMTSRKKCSGSSERKLSLKIWLLHLLGIDSGASYFSHSFLAWSNILWKTFSQLLLFCRRISSTLSMNSITASISNSFFCSSFETGRIIPEVCCISRD